MYHVIYFVRTMQFVRTWWYQHVPVCVICSIVASLSCGVSYVAVIYRQPRVVADSTTHTLERESPVAAWITLDPLVSSLVFYVALLVVHVCISCCTKYTMQSICQRIV